MFMTIFILIIFITAATALAATITASRHDARGSRSATQTESQDAASPRKFQIKPFIGKNPAEETDCPIAGSLAALNADGELVMARPLAMADPAETLETALASPAVSCACVAATPIRDGAAPSTHLAETDGGRIRFRHEAEDGQNDLLCGLFRTDDGPATPCLSHATGSLSLSFALSPALSGYSVSVSDIILKGVPASGWVYPGDAANGEANRWVTQEGEPSGRALYHACAATRTEDGDAGTAYFIPGGKPTLCYTTTAAAGGVITDVSYHEDPVPFPDMEGGKSYALRTTLGTANLVTDMEAPAQGKTPSPIPMQPITFTATVNPFNETPDTTVEPR